MIGPVVSTHDFASWSLQRKDRFFYAASHAKTGFPSVVNALQVYSMNVGYILSNICFYIHGDDHMACGLNIGILLIFRCWSPNSRVVLFRDGVSKDLIKVK